MKLRTIMSGLILLALTVNLISCNEQSAKKYSYKIGGTRIAELTSPPHVPVPDHKRTHALKQTVNLEIIEHVEEIAEGVDYTFWKFYQDNGRR